MYGHRLGNGKRVTRITNSKEKAIGLTQFLLFVTEDAAEYAKAASWDVMRSRNLVTEYKTTSSQAASKALLKRFTQESYA